MRKVIDFYERQRDKYLQCIGEYLDELVGLRADLARRDDLIKRLVADAEMLSIAMNWDEDEDGSEIVSCPHCLNYGVGKNRGKAVLDFGSHLPDCPITLHRALMKEVEG